MMQHYDLFHHNVTLNKQNLQLFRDHSRVAQWKRAGPITQRSEDQNLALLVVLSKTHTNFFLLQVHVPCRS